ncbi:hypothetical protein B0H11DRAFT_1905611 [Mycena galericulata]|nr:hypothetical protein B0H11DRAFT_1905611 [Mycena galericulata]
MNTAVGRKRRRGGQKSGARGGLEIARTVCARHGWHFRGEGVRRRGAAHGGRVFAARRRRPLYLPSGGGGWGGAVDHALRWRWMVLRHGWFDAGAIRRRPVGVGGWFEKRYGARHNCADFSGASGAAQNFSTRRTAPQAARSARARGGGRTAHRRRGCAARAGAWCGGDGGRGRGGRAGAAVDGGGSDRGALEAQEAEHPPPCGDGSTTTPSWRLPGGLRRLSWPSLAVGYVKWRRHFP